MERDGDGGGVGGAGGDRLWDGSGAPAVVVAAGPGAAGRGRVVRRERGGLRGRRRLRACPTLLCILLAWCPCALALNPALDISQYAHTARTVGEGFSLGTIFAMAQTPDGYLWLGGENGLFRFDGVRGIPWQPLAGQHLPDKPYSLLVTRDGTLWIGTFGGLATWNAGKLTQYPELNGLFVTSLLEDREETVWAATLGGSLGTPTGRLCAIRSGSAQCYTQDGAFGSFVWGLYEDGSGNLWAGAESGLWRWKPGPPRRYAIPRRISDLSKGDDGQALIAMSGSGLMQFAGGKVEPYPIPGAINPHRPLPDQDADSNKLLRDRDGGLWIGTHERGLVHVHQGRTDIFRKSDGLSGDIICSLFEDREGNIWVSTAGGLDRFREFPVTTISEKQGLSGDRTYSVIAAMDGSVWVGTHDGLTRWRNGLTTIFRKTNGLPDDAVQSLFQDDHGRIWVFTGHGLAYFNDGRFVAVNGILSEEVYSITGDKAGNLWLSGNRGLWHVLEGHLVEHFPWSALGRSQQAKVAVSDQGGVWLSFWTGGGVLYFKDGKVRASYTAADGLGKGHVPGLRLDRDGTLWAATEEGGLSRIKDGRIATLTSGNGLPCDTIHWTIEGDDRSLWLNTACGLVRILRSELDAWIADPKRRIATTVWDAAEGIRLRPVSPAYFGPPVAKSMDGKLWFLTGEGVQVVDPRHYAGNKLPPPVRIEQIVANHKIYWQNWTGAPVSNLRLPPRIHDLQIDYTALSLVLPEKVHFKYKLEGQDSDWREVVNHREVQYSNLPPNHYRFRVIACNNSGVWNETGDALDFTIDPAYYQTGWFQASLLAAFFALLWALYRYRLHRLAREYNARLEERVGERTRIARELHDTLLQSFQGLMLRFHVGVDRLPQGEAKEALEKALERGDQAIAEGRDAVHDLRSSAVVTNDLAEAVQALGDELASQDSAAFRLVVEGPPRNLHPILRDEIYRIAREAVRNAFRHAQASRIEAQITYGERALRLGVRDDGRGIERGVAQEGRAGHYGLPGMRERAKRIGAELNVWSEDGTGTEVELEVPGAIAYGTGSGRRGWWWSKSHDG